MLDEFASLLDDNPFEEIPVDARTFVESKDFLGQPALSKIQYDIVESMAQIYKQEDVERIMGVTEGRKYYKKFTKTEIIMALGKGTNIGSTKAWSCEYGWKSISDKLEDYGLIQSIGGSNAATAFYSEGEDEVFKVTTKFGYTFTGNLGHRFLAWKNSRHGKAYATRGAPQMLPISQVQTNDIAAIVGEWEEPKSPYRVTPSEARMIGYMIGDGTWLRKGSHGFRAPVFTNATPEVQKDFLSIVESLGGSAKEGTSGMGCWNVRVNGMTDWFIKHGLVQDYNELKSWNDAWMNMSRECLSQLLNGIWATDGWGSIQSQSLRKKEVKGLHVAIEMNSESLMGGIHMALLRLGVFSSFRQNRPLRGNGKHNPTWRVSITNPHFINKFLDTVGLPKGKEKVFSKIEAISREKRYKNLEKNGPVYRDRIVSIEHMGKQEVFSCTVESYHNYLGNGFIHGNSGKDFTSTVGVAYVVYKLLCLKDPARYYGKPPGDAIDIINVAINAQQAKNVFFKGFKNKIERSPWFAGRYYSKMDSIEFDKAITVYSGHSERESHEGLNLFMAILDEISGFGENANNIELGKSGANIYKAFRGTVDSRFPDYGKVVLLSFTRYEGDFISKKYDESIAEKDVIERKHTFVVNPDLPEDYPDNTFTIEWEEDHITKYKVPHVFALKRPTWEVNPTRSIDDFKIAFYTDPADARMRFLCLEENQKVWTSQGMQNIGDVRVGDLVESRFGPTRILRKEFDHKDCISIVLKNGQELVCTPDHKLLRVKTVRRGRSKDGQRVADRLGPYGLEWVEAGSLSNKDRLLLGSGNSLYSDNGIDEATAYLLGLMLADGNIRNDNRAYLNIACGTNEEYAKNVAALLKQVTGFGQVQKQKPNPILSDKVQYNVYSGKRSVATFFTNLGVKRVPAQEKTIPDVVWGMPRQSLLAFVSGFIDGDGTVSNQSGCISMYSTSKTMLTQMQLLVKALWGVTTQIGVSSRPKEGIVTSRYTLYGLRLNKAETLVALPELSLLAKSRPGPNPFVDKNKGRYLRQFAEVVSIESAGEKKVVDIQTEVGEFISNGIVVHNCQPTVSSDAFFRNKEKLQNAMSIRNPLDNSRRIEETWKPNPDKVYFVHADLAQRVDKCAVAVAHVEKWVQIEVMNQYTQIVPLVVVDMIAWWEPSKHGPVNLSDVKNWIINLRRRGVDLGLVTFDRWNSFDIQQELREVGIRSETLSVGKKHYEDLAMLVYEDRVVLPHLELLLQELTELKVVNDKKVDHPRKGCFVGETRIPLLDGTRPMIAELEGKEAWVYSAREDGVIVPGKARGRFTKMVDELVDVVLDTGAVVRCTPDHLWMLKNGEYKEARALRPGIDRLMPINQVWPVNGGYERVTDKNGNRTLTHHMAVGAPPDGHVIHHKNHVKSDNRPENLEIISLEEHSRQHTTGRHDDEDYREALYAGLKKWNGLDSTKKKRSEHMRSKPKEWYRDKARSTKSFRSDITIDSLLAIANDHEATNANAAARILSCGRNVVIRVLKDHGYESWQELAEQTGNNHKVRHVIPVKLESPVPVYDLEVDDWHNFALSAGVFVHNSKDLSDAMCGAVFNAISRTVRDLEPEIEIHTWAKGEEKTVIVEKEKPEVTEEVKEYLMNFGLL